MLEGRATFTVDGEEHRRARGHAACSSTWARMRSAVAAEAATRASSRSVAEPGAALPVSPFEHYYAAQPAYEAGDYDRAVAIASEGLADWPDHPLIHYQLACFHAAPGVSTRPAASLDIAFAGDERTRAWAAQDDDLAALRDQAPRAP